ncbi:MAG: DoxX family membrane protein [bacterium]|nr:DoxX family membrane protein [bacterium]
MGQFKRFFTWMEDNRVYFDLVRIYLGIGLFVKGLQFILAPEFLLLVLQRSDTIQFKFKFLETFLAHYIPLVHLGGGLLLAVGLMTRISAFFQLTVLVGAVGLSFLGENMFTHNQEFQFAALVLFLTLLILVRGAGQISVDHILKQRD